MVTLSNYGAYLLNGVDVVEDNVDAAKVLESRLGKTVSK